MRYLLLLFLSIPTLAENEYDYLFEGIEIKNEVNGNDYDRDRHFGDWIDADDDGQNTRQEVLAQESLISVTWDRNKVVAGLWYDPFTGRNFTHPNRKSGRKYAILQIDHMVPLKEAWESGAKNWSKAKRVKYANDMSNPGHLMAVRGGANGSKSDQDPADWLPPNEEFRCAYVLTWTGIKKEWGLSMDKREYDAIKGVLSNCIFEQ